MCLNIILSDDGGLLNVDGPLPNLNPRTSDTSAPRSSPPPVFCAAVIKLTAMQMQALGEQYSLEHICGGMSVFPTSEKTISMLLHLILPLCVRMGCGRRGKAIKISYIRIWCEWTDKVFHVLDLFCMLGTFLCLQHTRKHFN